MRRTISEQIEGFTKTIATKDTRPAPRSRHQAGDRGEAMGAAGAEEFDR